MSGKNKKRPGVKTANWSQAQLTVNGITKFKYHVMKHQGRNRSLLKRLANIEAEFRAAITDAKIDLETTFKDTNEQIKKLCGTPCPNHEMY